MTPEEKARLVIDKKLEQSGWTIQDKDEINLTAALGVAVREFPTSTGEVDYALFVDGKPVGVVEAKRAEAGEHITDVEAQSGRYANSSLKWIKNDYEIRFVYEATDKLVRFTDYADEKCRSREVFSFHQPKTLSDLLEQGKKTIRNNMKNFPPFAITGFRKCQINAINNLDISFSENRPKALVQMATGAGKTFTAITAAYRLLKYGKLKRILFLVDTKSLGEQAEREFLAYTPNDDTRSFSQLYGVRRLNSPYIPGDVQICISTIQRMYSILKGEDLDESAEETSFAEYATAESKAPKEVVYNKKYPPEFFDCIIVDECHRSIYNVWSQVLSYFDAFIIGLTATPDSRTFAFFNQNIVSEYSREQAIIDGVNVGEDIFLIETEVSKNGAHIMKQMLERRDRQTREKRWQELDEDVDYRPTQLDRDVVNPSQIRTVIRTFKENLFTTLFPNRKEVPKTLIFAKADSHADDIVQLVREEFGEGNDFCRKITYAAENPEAILSSFRNDYNPRIAVTVDMIATGTDVKPIECLVFMRDVRSKNYFEQMKGRGTRVLSKDDLQKVTPSATENKDHFVIVDAVGVTKSRKSETRTLERKPSVSLKELMLNVALGDRNEDTLTSLANRIIRLNSKMTTAERKQFEEKVGASAGKVAEELLNAFDEDIIREHAQKQTGKTYPTEAECKQAQKELIKSAVAPFHKPEVRDFIDGVRRNHEQLIDNVNLDTVLFAGFDTQQEETVNKVLTSFRTFIEEHKDEIIALRIIYDVKYKDRPMVIEKLKELYEKLKSQGITVERLWDCYAIKKPDKVKRGTLAQLTDLISIIRFDLGYADKLTPFSEKVNYNFMQWTFRKNAGHVQFTEEQIEWLRMIKDHIAASLSILPDDLDLTPFDRKGGLFGFYEAFGEEYEEILQEMNVELVA
ncbi:type I restriction-modification enzyme R subunit C-terminal domain-containing protein [Phascolarctobacterium succinatutens]|uniref:type I restriction endonuclease subunit R n=1 Tax=Phascolarctobacterium succinatutens TaxID=626940 RepID=UPI0026F325E5|nr:type I restriction-modification enzyme R subunit C-terminal domain-containing protein [Phascolarctobacterium succinatutens]